MSALAQPTGAAHSAGDRVEKPPACRPVGKLKHTLPRASSFSWDFAGRRPIQTGREAYRTCSPRRTYENYRLGNGLRRLGTGSGNAYGTRSRGRCAAENVGARKIHRRARLGGQIRPQHRPRPGDGARQAAHGYGADRHGRRHHPSPRNRFSGAPLHRHPDRVSEEAQFRSDHRFRRS